MDDREHQLQSPSIIHMFYNFMKRLATRALKIMTSGSKTARLPHGTPNPPHKTITDTSSADPPPHIEEKRRLEQETSVSEDTTQPRVPKKMVSIKENGEIINTSKKRSRKREPEVDDESTPLKSILKVSSDLNNDSEMLINGASNA